MNVTRLQDAFRTALADLGFEEVRILDRDPVFGTIDLAARER
jgi:hypothetical protein